MHELLFLLETFLVQWVSDPISQNHYTKKGTMFSAIYKPMSMPVFLLVLWFLLINSTQAVAADMQPYAGLESRKIKALSEQQIKGYLHGKGMGLALSGELNGYPGPKHVLELAETLGLTVAQRSQILQIFDAMQSQAIEVGRQVIEAERELEHLFADNTINVNSLNAATQHIGLLQGRLRAIHLNAHLETKDLLSIKQIDQYNQLRGYGDGNHSHHHDHGH